VPLQTVAKRTDICGDATSPINPALSEPLILSFYTYFLIQIIENEITGYLKRKIPLNFVPIINQFFCSH